MGGPVTSGKSTVAMVSLEMDHPVVAIGPFGC